MDVNNPYTLQPEKIIEKWIRSANISVYPLSERTKAVKLLEYFHRQVRCHEDQKDREDTLIYNWHELESVVSATPMWGELTGTHLIRVLHILGIDKRIDRGINVPKLEAKEFFEALLKDLPRYPRIHDKDLIICKNGLLYLLCEASRGRHIRDQKAIRETWLSVHKILKTCEILDRYKLDKSIEQRVRYFIKGQI